MLEKSWRFISQEGTSRNAVFSVNGVEWLRFLPNTVGPFVLILDDFGSVWWLWGKRIMRATSPVEPDKALHVVGKINQADLGPDSGQANGSPDSP